jgi:hypothetical protein
MKDMMGSLSDLMKGKTQAIFLARVVSRRIALAK